MEGPSPYQLNILPLVKKRLTTKMKTESSKKNKKVYGKYVSMKM